MKFFTIMLFALFTFFTMHVHAVGVLNQTAKVGQADSVKCVDGMKCSVTKGVLNLNAYHNWSVTTWASMDATPSVASGTIFNTFAASPTQTVTNFDDGVAGKSIKVFSKGLITFDVTGTNLKCGSTDVVTVSGDYSTWLYDGTDWQCESFIDASDNLN